MGERAVNARQLEVLEWIVAGCPDDAMAGVTYKTTAVALQNRRLVLVSKKKGLWRAEPTAAGRHFVEHGEYPTGHWSTTAPAGRGRAAGVEPATFESSSPTPESTAPPTRTQPRKPKAASLRPVEQMIAEVLDAGGSLDVTDGRNYYEGLVASANRYGKVPAGKVLRIERGRKWAEKTLVLADQPTWMTEVLKQVPVADSLVKPHPAVAALRAEKNGRLPFKRETRQRALRILDAVAKEASRRGHTVTCPQFSRDRDRHRAHNTSTPGDLLITIADHPHALHVVEEPDKMPHEPTARELRDFEACGYPRIPKYDTVPSGRLTITINGGTPVRQSAFGDTKTIDLTTRLAEVLQELELRAANSEERRRQAEEAATQRRLQWETVRAQAGIAVREEHRASLLQAEVDAWHRAHQLNAYIAAMGEHIASLTGEDRLAADDWLAWATTYAHRIDPLRGELRMPPDPEISHDALKPHMRGLSPYGPDRQYGW